MKKLFALLALPRSGTTLLTAILDAHPEMECWFEIYGSRKNKKLKVYKTFFELYLSFLKESGFIHKFKTFKAQKWKVLFYVFFRSKLINSLPFQYFLIKEVNTHVSGMQKFSGIEYVQKILENIQRNDKIKPEVIWIYRDIRHGYLSKVDGAKKWWGVPNATPSHNDYIEWIDEAWNGTKLIFETAKQHPTICISYEKLVSDFEETIILLLNKMEVPISGNIFNYPEFVNKRKINGDIGVAETPRLPNTNSIQKRNQEWADIEKDIYPLPENSRTKEERLFEIGKLFDKNGVSMLDEPEFKQKIELLLSES